jgi:Ni,Fe-hydrogenase III component G
MIDRRDKYMELTKNTSVDPAKMIGKNYIEAVNAKFPNTILDEEWSTPNQVTLTIKTNMLPDVVEYLYYQHEGWLPLVFGNDERSIHGNYAVYYVLSMEGEVKTFITIKALVDPVSLEFPSVTPKVKAAVWGERELFDMYGLKAVGLPDQRRLVLPDDWPDDLYPLRKDSMDYRLRPDPTTATETYEFINEKGEARIVPLGPLHITSDEPGHFRLFVDGEDIIDADYRLFYVHRGMEKLAETRMDYDQVNFLADRVCGICGFTHSVAYANSVESALGIKIPKRAEWIRAILLEVERLHSHLLNLGLSSHFTGFDTGFMQFFRVREKSMTLAEVLTGARKTYGINLIGGVRRDMLKHQREQCIKLIGEMREELKTLTDILLNTPNMEQRTVGVGVFAGLLHTINHSLAKTLLFCASGNILLKYKTRDMNQVRGLWRVAPMTAVLFAGGALALGGIPPFNVFVSEFSIAVAGIYAGKTWLMVFCLILLTIVLAGLSLMVLKTVLGKQLDNVEVGDVNKVSLVAMAILLLFMFIMGIHIAEPILQLLKSAVGIVLGSEQVSFGEMLVLPWQSLAQ